MPTGIYKRELTIEQRKKKSDKMKIMWKNPEFVAKFKANYRNPHSIFKKGHGMNKGRKNPSYSKIGENSFHWKGGKTIAKNGYVWVYCIEHPKNNHGYVLEHRLVVEKFIGRFLSDNEIVHHINGNKSDNRIENLMVFQSDREHLEFHAKMRRFPYFTNSMKREIENRWNYLKLLDSNPKLKEFK